ncbi:RNA recognition motif-containing protein [Phytophthora infestans]|uniref:RNA recognition motif-containing protein n=1 Tax=Phytophthora infestans TaxID=4787 RepID=A0A8S9UQR6_PHYIN|nr:RNA recognition motif-containing protein [Phytophthora infestans]
MSGFERILARVGGAALRSYCSSAIEDELRNLQTRMKTCLESVEQAMKVQEAVAKLDVPMSRENAATCAEIKRKYAKFSADLKGFVEEQRKLQAEAPEASPDDQQKQSEQQSRERVTKLLGKIQHRITRKRNDAWIDKNFADVETIASIIGDDDFAGPDKALRNELVLVLDHLISAVLLSPLTNQSTLEKMEKVLKKLADVHDDIDEYIKSSSELLTKKRAAYTSQNESNNIVDAAEEPRMKRQRVENTPQSDFLVKVERTAAAVAAAEAAGSDATYEVFVSDLPWGTTKEADVASYFGIAGAVVSVQMPTMADGSTVGVAIVRFATLEGMTLALRMDGYPFNGKNIRVVVHKSN